MNLIAAKAPAGKRFLLYACHISDDVLPGGLDHEIDCTLFVSEQ
jgi:hypothetical protein